MSETAKQMAENAKNRLMCDEFGNGWYSFSYDGFRQFCDQLCREQRDICLEAYKNYDPYFTDAYEAIMNAKQPEI